MRDELLVRGRVASCVFSVAMLKDYGGAWGGGRKPGVEDWAGGEGGGCCGGDYHFRGRVGNCWALRSFGWAYELRMKTFGRMCLFVQKLCICGWKTRLYWVHVYILPHSVPSQAVGRSRSVRMYVRATFQSTYPAKSASKKIGTRIRNDDPLWWEWKGLMRHVGGIHHTTWHDMT